MKRPIGVTVVGFTQAAICLFMGLPSIIAGVNSAAIDCMAMVTGRGGNLSGILIIFGLPVIAFGIACLKGFKAVVLMLKLDPKGRKDAVKFISIITILLVPAGTLNWIPFEMLDWALPSKLLLFIGIANIASLAFLMHPRVKEQFVKPETAGTAR